MDLSKRHCLKFRTKAPADGTRQCHAFTFVELLVVIVLLAVLAIFVVPALAAVQNKGGRLDCANNLRQIGMASMIFAGENNGWLPVCTLGAANAGGKTNYLGGVYYSYYLFTGTANLTVPTNASPSQGTFQNEGYLYQAGLAGNGSIFYCPGNWGTAEGANAYLPLLTADASGTVRSSYFYNPRMANPTLGGTISGPGNHRRYQTVSQLEPHRLFAVDSILPTGSTTGPGGSGGGLNPASIQHARDHGWNVLFTDGSVQFSRLTQANNADYNLITQQLSGNLESGISYVQYNTLFNWLEQDH